MVVANAAVICAAVAVSLRRARWRASMIRSRYLRRRDARNYDNSAVWKGRTPAPILGPHCAARASEATAVHGSPRSLRAKPGCNQPRPFERSMWPDRRLVDLFKTELPIVLAPMAGVMDAELVIAAAEGGALGSLPCAMLSV